MRIILEKLADSKTPFRGSDIGVAFSGLHARDSNNPLVCRLIKHLNVKVQSANYFSPAELRKIYLGLQAMNDHSSEVVTLFGTLASKLSATADKEEFSGRQLCGIVSSLRVMDGRSVGVSGTLKSVEKSFLRLQHIGGHPIQPDELCKAVSGLGKMSGSITGVSEVLGLLCKHIEQCRVPLSYHDIALAMSGVESMTAKSFTVQHLLDELKGRLREAISLKISGTSSIPPAGDDLLVMLTVVRKLGINNPEVLQFFLSLEKGLKYSAKTMSKDDAPLQQRSSTPIESHVLHSIQSELHQIGEKGQLTVELLPVLYSVCATKQ